MERNELLQRVLNATNHTELMDAYKDWAASYDTDLLEGFQYSAPTITAGVLNDYLDDKNARILDAGCGTGLVGEILKQQGYRDIDGLDYSADMLREAGKKNVYGNLIQADLTRRLDIPDNAYDAVICVGTFTLGHVGPEAFRELLRVTRKDGYICFTVRMTAYEQHDYRSKMLDLEVKKAWELQELRTATYFQSDNTPCKVALYNVAA